MPVVTVSTVGIRMRNFRHHPGIRNGAARHHSSSPPEEKGRRGTELADREVKRGKKTMPKHGFVQEWHLDVGAKYWRPKSWVTVLVSLELLMYSKVPSKCGLLFDLPDYWPE